MINRLKNIVKAFIVAFSVYSKIPMPGFKWESKDMQYSLCFFPFVGALIGGVEWALFCVTRDTQIPLLFSVMVAMAIPLIITGGIHIDGFMDTCDALHSYQPKERKLEILKDPHIGAFSVICLLIYSLLALGFMSVINDEKAVAICCVNFTLARVCSGFSVITMKSAKNDGMLYTFASVASKKIVLFVLGIELAACAIANIIIGGLFGIIALVVAGLIYVWYYLKSKKEFGGITGDLAGYFVSVEELAVVIVMGFMCILGE